MQHDLEPLYPKAMAMPHLTMPVSERDHIQGPATAAVTLVEYGVNYKIACRSFDNSVS